MIRNDNIIFDKDFFCKLLCQFVIFLFVIANFFYDKNQIIKILLLVTPVFLVLDYLRYDNKKIQDFYLKSVGLIKNSEKNNNVSDLSYLLLAIILLIFLTKKEIFITAFLLLAISTLIADIFFKIIASKEFFETNFSAVISFYVSGLFILFFSLIHFRLDFLFCFFGFCATFIASLVYSRPNFVNVNKNMAIPVSFSFIMVVFDFMWRII